ncbi:MAG: sigma-70 family RNA polymerase sigma factor [Eubacteriales bacterium]|nr:sigma-70 family RNA polymerase sigma factor [Eubacteriales bacterium]
MRQEYYEGLSDDELIALSREADDRATETLMSRYKALVRSRARTMYILGGDSEDLIQEGMLGLFKALRDYDCGRDASFSTFAALCVSRQLYTAVKASGRKKHMPLNTAVSLNAPAGTAPDGEKEGGAELEGAVSEEMNTLSAVGYGANPEKLMIDRENLARLHRRMETELSPLEKQVLELHLTGMNYVEIAHILNRDEKSTDNALQRIRAKVRGWIREG